MIVEVRNLDLMLQIGKINNDGFGHESKTLFGTKHWPYSAVVSKIGQQVGRVIVQTTAKF